MKTVERIEELERCVEELEDEVRKIQRIIQYSKDGEVTYKSTIFATPYDADDYMATYFYMNNHEYLVKGLYIYDATVKIVDGARGIIRTTEIHTGEKRVHLIDLKTSKVIVEKM